MSLSPPSPAPSFVSTSPQLLYAVSSTLLITLFVLPIYFAPQFARSFHSPPVNNLQKATIGVTLASTGLLVLYGVCGLIALGHGSLDAAISAGIFGTLSLLFIDVQAIVSVLWVERVGSWRQIIVFTGILLIALMLSTVFQVILLSLDNPSKGTLFALSHARGIFHLTFDLIIAGILSRRLYRATDQANASRDIESQQVGDSSSIGLDEVKLKSHAVPSDSRVSGTTACYFQHHRQAHLMFLQLLSTLLSVLSLSFPILQNYAPIGSLGTPFVPPGIFGTTTASSASIVLSLIVVVRWSGTLFELTAHSPPLRARDLETGPRPVSTATEFRGLVSTPLSFAPTSRPSTGNSLVRSSEGSSTLNTFNLVVDRPLNDRSRSHSVSSLLSLGANVPPRISEECERSQDDEGEEDRGSCALTDSSEDYFHSETFPAPFVEGGGEDILETRRFSRRSHDRPRSVSSPEPFYSRPISPRTPSPVATRTRKDAGRLSRPAFNRSFSSTSIISNTSPTLTRPNLSVNVNTEDTYHSAVSYTPARSSQQAESGRSTPSPSKSRRPSLRSLVGISTSRLPSSGDSPTNYRGGKRRGSRSSSISFLRGNLNQDEAITTPTLEIETDEDDPFATIQASQAIEATRKVEEWARRKASEKEMLSTEGGFEEDIEIVSPVRQSFERLGAPVQVTTSALAHLSDPSLHPRRSPSSSNSLFHEHLFSLEDSRNINLAESRSRSGTLSSAITLGSKAQTLANESTAKPYRFGKSFAPSPSLSSTPSSTKVLEVTGIRSNVNHPPRSGSYASRPLSSQVEKKEESPERVQARIRSSAPPPSSADVSPRLSPVRRIFSRRPSATSKIFSSSPPTISYPSPTQTRKGSRASSTFSSASFSLSKLRRGSGSRMLKPSLVKLGGGKGGGGSGRESQVSTASFRRSASSDLSFMCRGEGASSYQSSLRQSFARSASLDFQFDSSSHSSSLAVEAREVEDKPQLNNVASPGSPPRTTNWWTQGDFDARPLTPYRSSPRRSRKARSRTTSAPASISPKKRQLTSQDSSEEEEENSREAESPKPRHARSQSLPFDRLSDYQLKAPKRISPIGSLFLSFATGKEEDLTPNAQRTSSSTSLLLGPPLVLSQPSSKSTSARSSLSLTFSHLNQNFTTHSKDKTISDSDLQELTALCETFTPLEGPDDRVSSTSAEVEAIPISHPQAISPTSLASPLTPGLTTSSFSPSTFATVSSWPGADLSTSPTFSQLSPLSPTLPSATVSHSSIDYGTSRTSLESEPKGTMVDYWLRDRSQWSHDDEQECLEGTGEGEQMF
ncbi:hypothetical protein JCM5350_000184 [Sporobolomyces pararoseus]